MGETSQIDKFKPFEIFKKKRIKEDESKSESELRNLYDDLTDEEKLKYIKKAESKFDKSNPSDTINHDNCFSDHLVLNEQTLLLKSYGMPDSTIPSNPKYFYAKNYATDYGNFNQKLKEFDNLEDKIDILDAYHTVREKNFREFVKFLDELPPNRFIDYRKYAYQSDLAKKKETPKKKKNVFETKDRFIMPYDFHYNKHKDEFKNRNIARSAYVKLSNKKKIKYIKKCEKEFDENPEFKDRLLSSFLFKEDTMLLFESYGLPKKVAVQINNWFMQKHYNDYPNEIPQAKFKILIDRFKNLTQSEKAQEVKEHAKEKKEFEEKMKEFKKNLPARRKLDYDVLFGKGGILNSNKKSRAKSKKNKDETTDTEMNDSMRDEMPTDLDTRHDENETEDDNDDDDDDDKLTNGNGKNSLCEVLSSENDDKPKAKKMKK